MKTVQVPYFKTIWMPKTTRYEFEGFKKVKIKNKPDHTDINKITAILPGTACGYVPAERLIKEGKIPAQSFYDARQRTGFLKGHYVVVLPE